MAGEADDEAIGWLVVGEEVGKRGFDVKELDRNPPVCQDGGDIAGLEGPGAQCLGTSDGTAEICERRSVANTDR